MAYKVPGIVYSLKAAASLATKQFMFVKIDASGDAAAITAVTDKPIGVLQNKPDAAGKAAHILAQGISQLNVDGGTDVDEGDPLSVDDTGQGLKITVAAAASGKYVGGTAITAGTNDGTIITAAIQCLVPYQILDTDT